MRAFVFLLVAHQSLSDHVKLLAWILKAFLVCMAHVLSTVSDHTVLLCHYLSVDQLSRYSVPETRHVEAIDCGQDEPLLLPEEVIISLSSLLQLQSSREWKFEDFLDDPGGVKQPNSLHTDVKDCLAMLREVNQIVHGKATLVKQVYF